MFRTFTLPVSTSYSSIWDMLIAAGYCDSQGNMLVSGVKNNAIIPDRVAELDLRPADANTGDITCRDHQLIISLNAAQILINESKRSNRNSVCLKDYLFADAVETDSLVVEIEAL